MSSLLEVRKLVRSFSAERGWSLPDPSETPLFALSGVDLDLLAGESLAIVGESGSGKSTLGRIVLGLLPPTSGTVRFLGEELARIPARRLRHLRRHLQAVFQEPLGSLDPRQRAGDAIGEPLEVHGLAGKNARRSQVRALLREVGLPVEVEQRYPHELSGGERQRVAIARALAPGPRLLVADEPVTALDAPVRASIVRLLAERQRERGLGMLFITHELTLVPRVATRMVVLFQGRIVEAGPASGTLTAPSHPYTRALLDSVPTLGRGSGRRGRGGGAAQPREGPGPEGTAGGCPYRWRCPIARQLCVSSAPPLLPTSAGGAVACHFPGEIGFPAGASSGNWNFSREAT